MFRKYPIDPDHLRTTPPRGFGWVDHRLLREGYLARASTPAMALYLVLVCACDQEGLSYYSDPRLSQLLGVAESSVRQARHELVELGLVAYQKPLCQLLPLAERLPSARSGKVTSEPQQKLQKTVCAPATEDELVPINMSLKAAFEQFLSKGRND